MSWSKHNRGLVFTEAGRADAVRELRRAGLFNHVVCAGEAEPGEIAFASLFYTIAGHSSAAPTPPRTKRPSSSIRRGPPASPKASSTRTAGSSPSAI